MLPPACLHCLTIDFARAPQPVIAALRQRSRASDELRDLLCEAGQASTPLLVVQSRSSLSLVSTRESHIRAFRPILAVLREGLLGVAGWRDLPVTAAAGGDVARQLLAVSLRELCARRPVSSLSRELRAAAELSQACGAINTELSALVRVVEHAANRVWEETQLARPGASSAELALEILDADRIVEEELVAWQSSAPTLRSSGRPVSDIDIGPFGTEERHSVVRARPTPVLAKLRAG